jgi:hypothetical protein
MNLKKKIAALPDAKKIPKRWSNMKAAKESRHGRTKWKQNPLKIVHTPVAVKVFKQLDENLRHKMFAQIAEVREFNPRRLVTYQPVVSAAAVLQFAENEKLCHRKKAYVLGTEEGPCIWNGNHRAVAALVAGRKFKAIYLDLVGGDS